VKTEEEFNAFYQEVLVQKVASLEEMRLQTRFRYILLATSFTLILLFIFSYTWIHWGPQFLPAAILCCIGTAFCTYQLLAFLITQKYKTSFKESIVSEIIRFYDPRLIYDAEKGIQEKAVEISCLLDTSFGDLSSNDYVEGKVDDVFVQFSEVEVSQSVASGNGNFKGLFMIIQFNKNFDGDYLVLPDPNKHSIGTKIQNALGLNFMSEPIKMENPEFEAQFTVYGTDDIEARYLVTPAMMTRMVDFRSKVNGAVYFSFIRSHLFVAISSEKSPFEPSLFSPVDSETIFSWNRSLHFALSVAHDFNLNTRIWSKR
jgi:hypothetical protein